jgi:hypothetical protein
LVLLPQKLKKKATVLGTVVTDNNNKPTELVTVTTKIKKKATVLGTVTTKIEKKSHSTWYCYHKN